MKNSKQHVSLIATLVALSFSTMASAAGGEGDSRDYEHNQPPKPTPAPQVTVPININPHVDVGGTVIQKPEIEQNASIKQTVNAATNTGDIRNSATGGSLEIERGAFNNSATGGSLTLAPGAVQGGKVEIERGAFQNSVSGGNATIERGAVQNTVNGGKAVIEEGAVKNTNNNDIEVSAKGGAGGNAQSSATVEKGAVVVNVDNRQTATKPVRAIATTPSFMQVTPVAPTSFYPQGIPNSVGSAGLVNAYENHCTIQMSGDNNIVRADTGHEKIIAALDDQAQMGGAKTTPEVRIVKTPQQLASNSGRCLCLGTLQVESTIKPDEARENNMQTIHAAAGKWTRQNLRGFKQVQLLYVPNQSVTFQKGTAAHAGSGGFGAAVSAVIGRAVLGAAPSVGMTNGHTTDYPIVGVTYLMVGTIDGNEPPEGARTVELSPLMSELAAMPAPQAWSATPVAQPVQQAATITPPEVKQ